jgi:hypothetical protein
VPRSPDFAESVRPAERLNRGRSLDRLAKTACAGRECVDFVRPPVLDIEVMDNRGDLAWPDHSLRRRRVAGLRLLQAPDKIQVMPRVLTADDIIPLVASLSDNERVKLLRWIAAPHGSDASAYQAAPPTGDEFGGEDEPMAWEAEGWDQFR